jgi:hypothetical protein
MQVRAVGAFLSFVGYYHRFIKEFGAIAKPLTRLPQKEGFMWSSEAELTFTTLQCALTQAPVLQLSAFDAVFIVECDASGSGIDTVLHQGTSPITFFNRPLAPHHSKLAAYEWELIGLMQAVGHWRPYHWDDPSLCAHITTLSSTCWINACPPSLNITR